MGGAESEATAARTRPEEGMASTVEFVAYTRSGEEGSGRRRTHRALAAASAALLLVVMVLVVGQGTQGPPGFVSLQEMLRGGGQDAALKGMGGDSKTQQEMLVQQEIKKDIAAIVADGPKKVHKEIRKLRGEAEKEKTLLGKMDKAVDTQELALKKKLLVAKKQEQTGDVDESKAQSDVAKASEMRRKAQNLRAESDEARTRFVAAEKPVEIALKLARHDHKVYRTAEFAVAKEVTQLSEHPTNERLRHRVDGLVAKSKKAKRRMEGDSLLLKKLQKNTADAQLNGHHGYAELRAKSVSMAKDAESVAQRAVALAKEGHNAKAEAREAVQKVVKDIRAPDAVHAKSEREQREYQEHITDIHRLREAVDRENAAKEEQKKSAHTRTQSKYARERRELTREANGGPAKREGREGASARALQEGGAHKPKVRLTAQDSYDQLEDADEAKEKALLVTERAAKLHPKARQGSGEDADSGSGGRKSSELRDAEKRAHILGGKQSTFLAGLWGHTAPWDKEKGDVAREH